MLIIKFDMNALLFTLLPFVANPGLLFLYDWLVRKYYPKPYESKTRVILMAITYFISLGMILLVPEMVERFSDFRESM